MKIMQTETIVIRPKSAWKLVDWKELYRFRELFYIFAWRDIKVRYKQTVIGVAWAVFQPLMQMVIFTIFFGNLAKIPSGTLPYPVFVLTGLIFWTFFSNGVTLASNSFVENENLLKKVYFPKIILPTSAIMTSFVDFLVNLFLLFIVIIIFGIAVSPLILIVLPIVLLTTFFSIAGLGYLLSSINVKYRDVRYVLPFFIQTMLFLTPVIYSQTSVRPSFQLLLSLNPMTGVISSMRAVLENNQTLNWWLLLVSFVISLVVFFGGMAYLRKTERFFADIV